MRDPLRCLRVRGRSWPQQRLGSCKPAAGPSIGTIGCSRAAPTARFCRPKRPRANPPREQGNCLAAASRGHCSQLDDCTSVALDTGEVRAPLRGGIGRGLGLYGRPCSSAPLTLASKAFKRYSASASAEPKRRPGAASGPWWVRTQWASASRRSSGSAGAALVEHPLAEHDVAEQPALLGQPDLGAVGELAGLAEVVHERRGDQQVGIQTHVQLGDLERERADRDRVLEQPAEVRVVAAARARRAPPLGAQRGVAQQPVEQLAVGRVVDLAREVLEEAVELLDVAVGDRQEGRRIRGLCAGNARGPRSAARRGSARRGRRRGRGRRARSARPARRRRGTRARRSRPCGRAARAPGRACRCARSGGPCASRRRPRRPRPRPAGRRR